MSACDALGIFGSCVRILKQNASLWIKHIIISFCALFFVGPIKVFLEYYMQMYNLHQINLDPSSAEMHRTQVFLKMGSF